jgi:ribosome-binding factor A
MVPMARHFRFKRSDRVGDMIHREVSDMLIRGIKDPRTSLVTITAVRISDDLKMAQVYFSVRGGEEDRQRSSEGLDSAKGFIKREIGRRLRLKYVPDIVFKFDPSLEYADRIDRLIKGIHEEEDTCEEQ